MCSRRELETLIVIGLEELRGLETHLNQRLAALGKASRQRRISFLRNLIDLEERSRQLEELVDALDEGSRRTAPVAA
jgi:hypothetical protein